MEPFFFSAGNKLYNVYQIVSIELIEPNYIVVMSNGETLTTASTNPVLTEVISNR